MPQIWLPRPPALRGLGLAQRVVPMSDSTPASFFDTWDIYQKVVAGNYMFHREIGAELKRVLRAQFDGRPISILDLGCGDAAALVPLLEGLPLQAWTCRKPPSPWPRK